MTQERCIFCRIAGGEATAHRVYADDRAVAFLDIHPSALGHTLIIPMVHVARIEDLSEEDASALFRVLHRLTGSIQAAVGAEASTIGINNGPGSGQEIPHVHIHIIPRTASMHGGIIQGIVRSGRRPDEDELEQIAERIRKFS